MLPHLSKDQVCDLIPDDFQFDVSTVEDLLFLGQATIRCLIRLWRLDEARYVAIIKRVERLREVLSGKSVKDIRRQAELFEHPEFPAIAIALGARSTGLPEPIGKESFHRRNGSTTFNVCGWCQYTCMSSVGLYHNCALVSYCQFWIEAGVGDPKKRFDSPCRLIRATDAELDDLRERLDTRLRELTRDKQQIKDRIRKLFTLARSAEEKPALPKLRPIDWFKKGETVTRYIGGPFSRSVRDYFVSGVVIGPVPGIEYGVFVRYDRRVHNKKLLNGHGDEVRYVDPTLMHCWEYKYLLANPDFADLYCGYGESMMRQAIHIVASN